MDVVQPAVVVTDTSTKSANTATADTTVRTGSLRERLEYAALRAGLLVAHIMPVSWVTGVGAFVARTAGPWLRQHRRAIENLGIAFPEKTPEEREAIARAMWANMGRIFAETLILDRIMADPKCVEIVDHARWQTRLTEPGPSIGCTLHMGNWELAIWPLTLFGRRPAGVYRPIANPLVDAWLARTRSALYPGGLLGKGENDDDAKSGQRTARMLIDHARKGGCIGFVCDHYDRRGTPIRFMGRLSRFTTAPAMIARHVGARLWVGRCLRIGTSSRFRMDIKELDVPRTADKAGDARALTTAVFAAFEGWIREHPEQWMWWNTRWVQLNALQSSEREPPSPVA